MCGLRDYGVAWAEEVVALRDGLCGCGDGYVDCADGFAWECSCGSCYAGGGYGDVGVECLSCTLCHLECYFLAYLGELVYGLW